MADAAGAAPDGVVPDPQERKNDARKRGRKTRDPLTRAASKRKFLASFRETLDVTKSARACGRSTPTLYRWRRDDPRFRAKWARIDAEFPHVLESTARRFALRGVKEDVFHNGHVVGSKRRIFPKLILELLRAELPEKYRRGLIPTAEQVTDPDAAAAKVRERLRQMDASVEGPPTPPPDSTGPGPDAAPPPA